MPGVGVGVVSDCGVGVEAGVALGVGVVLGLGEAEGEGDFLGRGRRRLGVAVAPAFSIAFPVFSIPLPTVRSVAFVPFLTVSPVSVAAFLIGFSFFGVGV